jgi:hypothetical protein
VAQAIDLIQDASGPCRNRLPRLGHGDCAAVATEQLRSDLGLEPLDLVREGGLRDVELLGRPGEVPVPGDGLDVSELTKLHGGLIVNHD